MKRHRLDATKQLFHGITLVSVTHRQDISDVIEKHLHAHGLCHDRQLLANIAVADNA